MSKNTVITLEDCIEWMAAYVVTDGSMPSERVAAMLNRDVQPAILSHLRDYQKSRHAPPPVATTPEPEREAMNSSGVSMTTPTKPTKEATTPLPVLTTDAVRVLRDLANAILSAGYPADVVRLSPQEAIALADHWLRTQAGQAQWIPVTQRLPTHEGTYPVTREGSPWLPAVFTADFRHGVFLNDGNIGAVTAWLDVQPFAPPQEPA